MNTITPRLGNISQKYKQKRNKNRTLSPNYQSNKSNISFKGGPATLISAADKEIMNVFSQHYGNIGERLGQKVGKLVTSSEILKRSSRFSLEQGARSIREKKVPQALLENVLFPFVNLPLYAVSWVLKKAQNIPSLKDSARKLYNKPLLRIPRKLNELDSKTDMLKGIFEKTEDVVKKFAKEKGINSDDLLKILNNADDNSALKKEATEYIKESLYKVSNKFFDKHTGNFNTAYERPLNRIVTGLIPVAFLANDAYNLSVLCGDKKEDSNKEAHERAKQEISRVLTTAYIQLLTFGAFTKQVNTIPWFTPLTSASTVLFSETSSRKRLGKPIFFLSKEKAKEYNRKEAEKNLKEKDGSEIATTKIAASNENKPAQIKNLSFDIDKNEPQVFTSFKSASQNNTSQTNKEEKSKEPKKALINFNTFKKGVAILVTAGFALSFIKNSSYTKNTKLVKGIKDLGDKITKKIYNPLAYKDFEISQNDFEKMAQSLKEAGCKEIAEGHEFIKGKYGRQTAEGTIKMYKAALSSSQIPNIIKSAIDKIKSSDATLSEKEIAQMKDGVILINCARGGLYNEDDLYEGLKTKKIAWAGIDVFNKEPATDNKLLDLDNIYVTPHIGANTLESQEKIAIEAANAAISAARGSAFPNALNLPTKTHDMPDSILSYLELTQKLGYFAAQTVRGAISSIHISINGKVLEKYQDACLTFALVGALKPSLDDSINYVNASFVAKDRGVTSHVDFRHDSGPYKNLITLTLTTEQENISVSGTVYDSHIIRFNNINGFNMDLEPRGNMILVKNTDVPGVIGSIGNTIAQHNVNIADFRLGRNGDLHTKEALALILVDSPISQSLLDALCAIPECISVRSVLM